MPQDSIARGQLIRRPGQAHAVLPGRDGVLREAQLLDRLLDGPPGQVKGAPKLVDRPRVARDSQEHEDALRRNHSGCSVPARRAATTRSWPATASSQVE